MRAAITRRGLLVTGAVTGAALALPRAARAEPATAILGIDADPPTLNPALSTDYGTGDVGAKILEGLVWLDRTYTPQPSLATARFPERRPRRSVRTQCRWLRARG